MKPVFFPTSADFRAWLEEHHKTATEVLVGLYNKRSGKPTLVWSEFVDQGLCFGWIDGVRKSIDAGSYSNRFTPRKPGSTWSDKNIKRFRELQAEGLVKPAGVRAFEARVDERSGTYSYEQRDQARFSPEHEQQFRANREAWDYFQARAPWYRKTAIWWVVSAKREETRGTRLTTLIEKSAQKRPIPALDRSPKG